MTDNHENDLDVRRIRRLLLEMAELAQHACLTGSLRGGTRNAVRRYNTIIDLLEKDGKIRRDLFQTLPEETSFEELGVESALLAGYLKEDRERANCDTQILRNDIVTQAADLKGLGDLIRENLSEWLQGAATQAGERQQAAREAEAASLTEVESRLVEVGAQLQAIAEQLRRGDLTDERRADLAEQLSRYGQEQAQLARRHARLREG